MITCQLVLVVLVSFISHASDTSDIIGLEYGGDSNQDIWMKGIDKVLVKRSHISSVSYNGARKDDECVLTKVAPSELDKTAALFAAAAYCKPSSLENWECGDRCGGETQGTRLLKYFSFPRNNTTGYIAINTRLRMVIVAFRGSESFANWLMNMKTWTQKAPWPGTNVYVHSGFLNGYLEASEMVRTQVLEALSVNPDYTVLCVGHSLGGALTTLAAIDLQVNVPCINENIHLINFGAPRVGDHSWPAFFASKIGLRSSRWVNRADIVPHVPPMFFGFNHSPREHWISVTGEIIACDSVNGEDPHCSDSLYMPNSVTDHLHMFGIHFGPYC